MAKALTVPRLFETKEGLLNKNDILFSKDDVWFIYDKPVSEQDVRNGLLHCLKKAERAKKIESAETMAGQAKIVHEGPLAVYKVSLDNLGALVARYPPDKGAIGPKPAPPPIITFLGRKFFDKIKVPILPAIYGTNKIGR